MKRIILFILCLALVGSMVACSENTPKTTELQPTEPEKEVITDEVRKKLDAILEERNYQGIAYLTRNGKVVYEYVSGTNDMGETMTMDSRMYLCSVSKHFCATAILMLRDRGELSLDDTLEKYFPEYTIGKDITLKNLLCMRSGISRDFEAVLRNPELYAQKSAEEINAEMKDWIFNQPLIFKPDTQWAYSNINYILLSYVVEMVSQQSYEDFIRQNIFEPVGMIHTGFCNEVPAYPEWGLTYDNLLPGCMLGDQAQGCGDIVSTVADMDLWMTALPSGKLITRESFEEMTTDYSRGQTGTLYGYGYGLSGWIRDGWGHSGGNLGYSSWMYFNEAYGYNFFIATGKNPKYQPDYTQKVVTTFLSTVFAAEGAPKN